MRDISILAVGALLVISIYVSFVVMPRRAAVKKQIRYISDLKIGDEVVTFGGIIGCIIEIDTAKGVAVVEIADGVTVRILTDALMQQVNSIAVVPNTDDKTNETPIPAESE
ncbi:MAG: hypothetical protein D6737_11775 [Chloroflexi bacterium]|nr:MAG: hypothetical protein CUN54_00430 [Phototrophicales bacterium]RMF79322.1 MAG: hypothetical protein D6737_11775 [Chloroflexota bacterium]